MSPRKTRRGRARGDVDTTISTTINDSLPPETPSSRSVRSRRLKDPEVVDSPEPLRRTRRTVTESLEISLNTTVGRRRGRKPKISDDKLSEDVSEEVVPPSHGKKREARGKRTKNQKSEEKREEPVIPPEKLENPPDSDDNEVANVSSTMSKSIPQNRRFRQLRGKNNSPNNVTPESSPITVILTPHRSTKTPRKSPVSLGSPKSHSLSPRRLSKTPRKLSVIAASPIPSDNSSSNGTPSQPSKSPVKTPKTSPKPSKSKNRTTLHSKTPRIVLKKSKTKSPSSVRSSRVKKSPKKPTTPKTPPIIDSEDSRSKKSPGTPENFVAEIPKVKKSLRTPEILDVDSPTVKKSPKTPEVVNLEKSRSPQVILERISPQDSPQVSSPKSPRLTSRLHSLAKGDVRSSTPRERAREIHEALNICAESPLNVHRFYGSPQDAAKFLFLEDVSNPLINDSFGISGIKPTEEEEEEKKEEEDEEKVDDRTNSIHRNSTYELLEPRTPNLRNKKYQGDGTYELDEPKTPGLLKSTKKRSLEGGESPGGSKRVCRVRFASPGVRTPKKTPKIVVRSRSATPNSQIVKKRSPTGTNCLKRRSISMSSLIKSPGSALKTPGPEASGKWTQKAQNESTSRLSKPRASIVPGETDKKKKANSSAKKAPNFAQIHQKKFERMESLVDAKKRLELRHNTLTSSNIGNIKGEDEVKARIMQEPKAKIIPEPKAGFNRFGFKILGPEKKAEGYNRFGYKLRKEEATKIVSRPTAAKIEERKEVKRMALKGVRTNKRFELLMKSRNMK
ncbi:serine/arginine repetitive matrix protein 5 [Fopius arisanus]|uniref:Serine/arginine repetitive matrix protein 5 n=1 Tax=Fopius arisanus TaxID=64838 RepID=A0A0C9QHM2_9HYME|nr:PREDICTED: serine/arginine repetitive matrix protein 5-like [Fopius arisanus]